MIYVSKLPSWGYVQEELDYIDSVAVDQNKDGYYVIE